MQDHPVWSGALSALMGSERLPQLEPGSEPACRVGGGSLKGDKNLPNQTNPGTYNQQRYSAAINTFSLLSAKYDLGF